MNQIVLKVERGMWVAEHSGPASDEIQELFGTRTIQTPFSTSTNTETVLSEVTRLNPEFNVVISIMAMIEAQAS